MTNIGKTLSGKQFNELYKNTIFCKVLNDNLTHHNFKYRKGLNIDTNIFNATGECSKGGLYFCDMNFIDLYISYGSKFSYVAIPE